MKGRFRQSAATPRRTSQSSRSGPRKLRRAAPNGGREGLSGKRRSSGTHSCGAVLPSSPSKGRAGKVERESRDDPPEGIENLDRRAERSDRQIGGDPDRESEILAAEVAERRPPRTSGRRPGGFEEGRPTCARVLQHCRSDRALDEIPDGYPLEPGDPRIESRDGQEEERERHPPAHRARAEQTERREREGREENHVSVSTARERPESKPRGREGPRSLAGYGLAGAEGDIPRAMPRRRAR